MWSRTAWARLGMVTLVGAASLLPRGDQAPVDVEARPAPVPVSMSPTMTVSGGSAAQRARLGQALARFHAAGLALPDLDVVFHAGTGPCRDHDGLFQTATVPWRISICGSGKDYVYEHELAHAWEVANLTDRDRHRFMALRGYEEWGDQDVPWNRRGSERVAFVIQKGLSGLPLPRRLSAENRERLESFELLAGRPAPRLVEWELRYGARS